MKSYLIPTFVLSACLCFFGCRPEEIGPDTSFIEYTIEGKTYRINSTNSTIDGSHSGQYVIAPPSHILTTVFSSSTNEDVASITLLLNWADSLRVQRYENVSVGNGAQFIAVQSDLEGYGLDPQNGTGFIDLNSFDSASGGEVSGTFEFDNVNYFDKDRNVLSSGHKVTNGSFRVFMD